MAISLCYTSWAFKVKMIKGSDLAVRKIKVFKLATFFVEIPRRIEMHGFAKNVRYAPGVKPGALASFAAHADGWDSRSPQTQDEQIRDAGANAASEEERSDNVVIGFIIRVDVF